MTAPKDKYVAEIAYFKGHCTKHNVNPIIRTNQKREIELWFRRDGHSLSEFYGFAHDVKDVLPA